MGWVALKALLLYLTAVLGFRVGQRHTLADLSPFDFVAAVAVGSSVGRVPNAGDASCLAGAATLVAVLAAHGCLTQQRGPPRGGQTARDRRRHPGQGAPRASPPGGSA